MQMGKLGGHISILSLHQVRPAHASIGGTEENRGRESPHSTSQSEEECKRCRDSGHLGRGKMPDCIRNLCPRQGDQLIQHHIRRMSQPTDWRRHDGPAKERSLRPLTARNERHDHGLRSTKQIRLENQRRSRLSVIARRCDNDNVSALQVHPETSITRSMNSSAFFSCASFRNARHCRRASLENPGRRISGTHIWMGLKPRARREARCLRTRTLPAGTFAAGNVLLDFGTEDILLLLHVTAQSQSVRIALYPI